MASLVLVISFPRKILKALLSFQSDGSLGGREGDCVKEWGKIIRLIFYAFYMVCATVWDRAFPCEKWARWLGARNALRSHHADVALLRSHSYTYKCLHPAFPHPTVIFILVHTFRAYSFLV